MKKKIIIFIISILTVVTLFFIINLYTRGNLWFNIQMLGIDKDIIIEKRGGITEVGGYASSAYDYYVDLDKKKIYEVSDYHVYGVAASWEKRFTLHNRKNKKIK